MAAQLQQPMRSYTSHERSNRSRSEDEMGAQSQRSPASRGGFKFWKRKSDNVKLVPRPSNSPDDPLNWSSLKKNLHFASLMLIVATIGTLKTLLTPTNAVVATELSVYYGATAALSGVPFIIGAVFGVQSKILAESIGKRGIYLVSSIMMLLAAVWNMHVVGSYAEFMASRVVQAIGWGMFEVLVEGSIEDMFFDHERPTRTIIHNTISILFTWGSPILGGYLSQNSESFRNEIMILNIIQAFGIFSLIFLAPESTFNRSFAETPVSKRVGFKGYLSSLRPTGPHSTKSFSKHSAFRIIKALITPSALLTTLLTAPLLGTAYGMAQSLSLLFSAMPTFLFPCRLGYLFILPALFSLLTFTISSILARRGLTLGSAGMGLVLGVAGVLSFGLYTMTALGSENSQTIFSLNTGDQGFSLRTVSALFGLLVCGAVALATSGDAYLAAHSTEVKDAQKTLQEFMVGIFIITVPMWVEGKAMGMEMDVQASMWMGLREATIALTVVVGVVGSTICAALWSKGASLKERDWKILGEKRNYEMEGKSESGFFEA